jgi:hypothetical protein
MTIAIGHQLYRLPELNSDHDGCCLKVEAVFIFLIVFRAKSVFVIFVIVVRKLSDYGL